MQIQSFKHACRITGESEKLPFKSPKTKRQKATNLWYQLSTIVEAINPKGYIPNYNDRKEEKWYAYFGFRVTLGERVEKKNIYHKGSGFAFLTAYHVYTNSSAGAGGWFCFKTRTDAEWFGVHFEKLNSEFLMLKLQIEIEDKISSQF